MNEETSVIRNISFQNLVLDTKAGNSIFLAGLPESKLVDIHMKNIFSLGKYGMKAYNIDKLSLNNVFVSADEGKPVEFFNVDYSGAYTHVQ